MKAIERLRTLDGETRLVEHIGATLAWDQETYMPSGAIEERADQLAYIEALAHDKAISPEIGELLEAAGSTPERPSGPESIASIDRAYLRVMRRKYDKATKLPTALVAEMAKATSLSQAAWAEARKNNDFKAFEPHLSAMVSYNKRVASCLAPDRPAYDVLLDRYEEGNDEASTRSVFDPLREGLSSLLDAIRGRPQIDDAALRRPCPAAAQAAASDYFMRLLGYDMTRGRIDVTAHPFTTTLGESDVRITTRYEEGFFPSSLFSTLHETGHALYELGIAPSPEYRRTSLAEASSMAVHESQSRLWENMVGRSLGFWLHGFPALKATLGPVLDGVDVEAFHRAVNKVEPSLVRVEADEVSYGLHVILRFELESALMAGSLSVADLPAAWNDGMERLLGVRPRSDAEGCLQDVHWAGGMIGYFPSYALGNLYAAQWWDAMRRQGVGPDEAVARGDLGSVLSWLRTNVHKPGSAYSPAELVAKASGRALDPGLFMAYLRDKYSGIYGL